MSRNQGTTEGMTQARRLQRARQITEDLFLLLSAVCFVYNCMEMSKLKISFPSGFGTQLMLVLALVMIARLILRRKGRWEILWVGLPLSLVCMETYITTGRYARLPFIAILIMGLDGIDYRKILRTYLVAVGSYITATVLAGLGGGVSDLVYYRDGLRSSWGTAYPTDFSSVILFLTMTVWLARPELSNAGMLALGLVPILLALLITGSRNSLICGILFEIVVIYRCLEIGIFSRKRRFRRIQQCVDTLLTLALPVCAATILLLVFLYSKNPELMERANFLLSERLRLSVQGFQNYPLLPFGNWIITNGGMGGTVFFKVAADQYFFLDSSYVSMLLRYGWVTTLGLSAVWIWMTRRAIRAGNRRMALVMAVVAVHSIMEHHFPDFFHNILLIMPLAKLRNETTDERVACPTRRTVAFGAVMAVLLALGVLFLPRVMSWLRTIYGAMGWQNGEATDSVLGLNVALIAGIAGAAWAAYRLLTCLIERRQRQIAFPAVVLALCLTLGFGVCLWGNGVIEDAVLNNAALVEADADALTRLGDVTICSDVLPEVYRRRFGNIRPTVYGGEDLARYPGATVLTRMP